MHLLKKRIVDSIINTVSITHIFLNLICLIADLSIRRITNTINIKPIIKAWLNEVHTPARIYNIYNTIDNGENNKSGVIFIFFIIFS